MTTRRAPIALVLAGAILLGACTSSTAKSDPDSGSTQQLPTLDLAAAGAAVFTAGGSVGQVHVTGADARESLQLVRSDGSVLAKEAADARGSLIFRNVPPADGYRVAAGSGADLVASTSLAVTDWMSPPPASFYAQQEVRDGYQYLRTRDGITLAMTVHLPGPADEGPYPTVIEYSGYSPADPESPQPSTMIAQALGYATVGINMRGTGCSGGAFDFFEQLQSTDGYDAIETIAAQPWVAHGRVGMVGLSYPGISQLFVAQLRPPHLAAIAPLSVIDDTITGTLAPGGILNTGFAVQWAKDRQHDAQPAPGGGQDWATDRIEGGDEECEANQALHSQAPDLLARIRENTYWTDEIGLPLSPEHFVDRIDVPTYLVGDWQDEQTGGYFANLFDRFDPNNNDVWLTAQNGGHADPLDPWTFARWAQFLSIFVAREVPKPSAQVGVVASVIASTAFGTSAPLPADPFAGVTGYDEAKAIFEEFPRVRILFENGGGADAGAPEPRFEAGFPSWPIPGTDATAWYFGADGTLVPDAPAGGGADSYRYDPSRMHDTTLDASAGQSGPWAKLPAWNWVAPEAGTALAYETAPLASDVTAIGNASVDLWLKSTAPDTDLQVTLTEVRPDGQEVYVQNGWLRASNRALGADATELRPTHPLTEEAVQTLPSDEYSETRVEVFPFAHVFRKGSRIRVIIDAPGASRPSWSFEAFPKVGDQVNTVGWGSDAASRIVLPVVPGVEVAAGLPACPGLRGQPCRPVATIADGPAAL
jgi:predicted acyl esterase